MRTFLFALVALLLAGCNAPASDGPGAPVTDPSVAAAPLVVADGTYEYHELQGDPSLDTVMQAFEAGSQAVTTPCSYEGAAYFSNRQIPTVGGAHAIRNGTLRVTFDWTDEDYRMPTMVLGYRAPGMTTVLDSPRIPRGETTEIRIEPDATETNGWALFACLNRSGDNPPDAGWQPGPFLGSFTVRAEFHPDPPPGPAA